MRFKHKFSFDKRRKLQSGKYPIKVNLHSYSDNKNYYFSIPALYSSNGRLEFSCSNIEEFNSVWTDRHKKDSFGNIVGETTVYGSKLELRIGLKIQYDRLNSILENTKNGVQVSNGLNTLSVTSDVPILRADLVDGFKSLFYMQKQSVPVLEVEFGSAGKISTEFSWAS